jgi:hypothetical protein
MFLVVENVSRPGMQVRNFQRQLFWGKTATIVTKKGILHENHA